MGVFGMSELGFSKKIIYSFCGEKQNIPGSDFKQIIYYNLHIDTEFL